MGAISLMIACLIAMATAWLGTPLVLRLAERVGAIDKPDERKIHIRPIPRLGGAAVFLAFTVALAVQVAVRPELQTSWIVQREGITFYAALLIMFLLGLWDDIRTLKPLEKLLVQILLSSLVYVAGFRVSLVPNSVIGDLTQIGVIDFLVTTCEDAGARRPRHNRRDAGATRSSRLRLGIDSSVGRRHDIPGGLGRMMDVEPGGDWLAARAG